MLIARTDDAFVSIAGATINERTANGFDCGSIGLRPANAGPARCDPASRVDDYLRCLLTSFVISNMFTAALPPNTVFRGASALIMRLFLASWRPFFLM